MSPNAVRTLIVNADDFGLSDGVNAGIVRAFTHGIVRSTSLMVHAPSAAAAADLARMHAGLGVGLHVDLGEWEFVGGEWRPLYERVQLDDATLVAAEIRAQLARFEKLMAGQSPTHIDSHQHVHLRAPLRSVLLDCAGAMGVPLRHLSGHTRYVGDFYGQDNDGSTIPGRLTARFLSALIQELPAGVNEICCHPAAYVDFGGMYREQRITELQVLCDDSVLQAANACALQNFRTLSTMHPESNVNVGSPMVTS